MSDKEKQQEAIEFLEFYKEDYEANHESVSDGYCWDFQDKDLPTLKYIQEKMLKYDRKLFDNPAMNYALIKKSVAFVDSVIEKLSNNHRVELNPFPYHVIYCLLTCMKVGDIIQKI